MAYFGRKPKKPGSVPGAANGFVQKERVQRLGAAVRRLTSQPRAVRPGRASKAVRAARSQRSGR